MEIGRYLVLSTAHIRCATGQLLTDWANLEPHVQPLLVAPTHHGWFIGSYIPPEEKQPDLPQELPAILDLARGHGCDYVLLDCDGPVEGMFPTFPW